MFTSISTTAIVPEFEGIVAVIRKHDVEPGRLQHLADDALVQLVVVGDEDPNSAALGPERNHDRGAAGGAMQRELRDGQRRGPILRREGGLKP
jgi:hypothetical protein